MTMTTMQRPRVFWAGLGLAALGLTIANFPILGIPSAIVWPLLGVVLAIALIGWLAATGLIARIAVNLETALTAQPSKGILIAIPLTAVYVTALYVIFMVLTPWLQGHLMADWRLVTGSAIVMGLVVLVPFIRLYKATGFPFEATNLEKSTWALAAITIIVFAFILNEQPNRFFDRDGSPLAMVAEDEGQVYYLDPGDCVDPTPCYSPATREKLIPITPELAKIHKQESPLEKFWDIWDDLTAKGEADADARLRDTTPHRYGSMENPYLLKNGSRFFIELKGPRDVRVFRKQGGMNIWFDIFDDNVEVSVRFHATGTGVWSALRVFTSTSVATVPGRSDMWEFSAPTLSPGEQVGITVLGKPYQKL